jgi:CheY-like chemotaxis protein
MLDLNNTVSGMIKMLERLIGEDIDLDWKPGKTLWPVKVDPSQIDQIMANLTVNARDAISDVGRITIETQNKTIDKAYSDSRLGFKPGDYVRLTVSDDGCGMDNETLENIYEPFFTTKGVGEGTGLGLSTVYGIVKQNDGFIDVYSEPGQGSVFKIYFPSHQGSTKGEKYGSAEEIHKTGHENILLVEDEPAMLNMTRQVLESQGYTVLTANTPGEAIALTEEKAGKLDLLLTDVVLPEMNGLDLAKEITARYPEIKCLFSSGYTSDVVVHHGVLDEGVHFIEKPYSLTDLYKKIREVLGGD